MTDDEIEKISQRVAKLVIELMPEMKIEIVDDEQEWEFTLEEETIEQDLLVSLAKCMTELDYNLKAENYAKCGELQDEIVKIEDKLKKYK